MAYRYVYPPRPDFFHRDGLVNLNLDDYAVQLKLNDTRLVIAYCPKDGVKLHTRHNTEQLAYKPKADTIEQFMALPFDKSHEQIFDALLLHNKNSTVKNTWVLLDWLVRDGQYQLGTSFLKRDLQLDGLGTRQIEHQTGMRLGWAYSENIWKAISYMGKETNSLLDTYQKYWATNQLVEGVVLKHLGRPLKMPSEKSYCDWAFKIRYKKEGIYDY